MAKSNPNVGITISGDELGETIPAASDAITDLTHEIGTHPTEIDIAIAGNLVFTSGSAEHKSNTARYIFSAFSLSLMVGFSE